LVSKIRRSFLLIAVALLVVAVSSTSVFAASSTINSRKYTHPAFYKASLYRLFHGVDVSVWQGAINWNKSKKAGIDFAILRCGYTALSKFTLHQDSTFVTNYKNANKAGVSVGIYYYACATTAAEAKKEANYVISILKNNGVNNQLPVVMDYEIDSGRANTVYKSLVSKKGKAYARKRFTSNAKTFMNTLKASGYDTMFYSYRVMVDPKISANYRFNMSEINGSSQYRFWLAQYSTSNSYSGKMELWQFSSTGRVSGMNGNIDRNFWYYPLSGVDTKSGTTNIRKCKITLGASEYKYDGTVKEPAVTVKNGSKKLKNNTDYTVSYMNNIKKGTATVLIHGKGNYSNETYATFKIDDENNGKDTTSKVSTNTGNNTNPAASTPTSSTAKPAKVTGIKTAMHVTDGKLDLSWKSATGATKYRIAYKVNGASKFSYASTKNLSYTIKGLKIGSIVELKIISQNVVNKKTQNGKASGTKYIYMRRQNNTAKVLANNKIQILWPTISDSKGKVNYHIIQDCVDVSKKAYDTTALTKTIKGTNRYFYDVYVRPELVKDGHKYLGDYGIKTHPYLIYGKINSAKSLDGGFKVTYPETTGIGNPKYIIKYSTSKNMANAKSKIHTQKVTSCTVKNLEHGKTYYVTVQTYKIHKGVSYYGVVSAPATVVTK